MKMNRIILFLAFSALFACISLNLSAQKEHKKTNKKQNDQKLEKPKFDADVDFAVNAADAGLFEVLASALAKTNASSEKVKMLSDHIISDRSNINEELKKIATKKNIAIPEKLSIKMQDKFDKLTKLKGDDFDKAYTKIMIDEHIDAINLFEKEAEKGKDSELKTWAAGKIPTLRSHQKMAESTNEMIK